MATLRERAPQFPAHNVYRCGNLFVVEMQNISRTTSEYFAIKCGHNTMRKLAQTTAQTYVDFVSVLGAV